jgi:Ankyrin repeat
MNSFVCSDSEIMLPRRDAHRNLERDFSQPNLWDAIRTNDVDSLRQLLSANAKLVSQRDAKGWLPLHHAAERLDGTATVNVLLSHGADVNALTMNCRSALQLAVENGSSCAATVGALLAHDAEYVPFERNRIGRTLMDTAAFNGDIQVLRLLWLFGGDGPLRRQIDGGGGGGRRRLPLDYAEIALAGEAYEFLYDLTHMPAAVPLKWLCVRRLVVARETRAAELPVAMFHPFSGAVFHAMREASQVESLHPPSPSPSTPSRTLIRPPNFRSPFGTSDSSSSSSSSSDDQDDDDDDESSSDDDDQDDGNENEKKREYNEDREQRRSSRPRAKRTRRE